MWLTSEKSFEASWLKFNKDKRVVEQIVLNPNAPTSVIKKYLAQFLTYTENNLKVCSDNWNQKRKFFSNYFSQISCNDEKSSYLNNILFKLECFNDAPYTIKRNYVKKFVKDEMNLKKLKKLEINKFNNCDKLLAELCLLYGTLIVLQIENSEIEDFSEKYVRKFLELVNVDDMHNSTHILNILHEILLTINKMPKNNFRPDSKKQIIYNVIYKLIISNPKRIPNSKSNHVKILVLKIQNIMKQIIDNKNYNILKKTLEDQLLIDVTNMNNKHNQGIKHEINNLCYNDIIGTLN